MYTNNHLKFICHGSKRIINLSPIVCNHVLNTSNHHPAVSPFSNNILVYQENKNEIMFIRS